MTLPNIGAEGQRKLAKSKVLVVGLGGLGIPCLQYLSGSGVGAVGLGKIGVMDDDQIELSNLSRQPLFGFDDLGKNKSIVVAEKLNQLNPSLEIVPINSKLTLTNSVKIISKYDLVIDATDNFPAKFLIHDTCFVLGKKLVQAALYQEEGLLRFFDFSTDQKPACLRCLWQMPDPDCTDNCSESGIIPATAGIVGSYQAMLAIRLLLGWIVVEPEINFETILSFSDFQNRRVKWRKSSQCPLCSKPELKEIKGRLNQLHKNQLHGQKFNDHREISNKTKQEIKITEKNFQEIFDHFLKETQTQSAPSQTRLAILDVRTEAEQKNDPLIKSIEEFINNRVNNPILKWKSKDKKSFLQSIDLLNLPTHNNQENQKKFSDKFLNTITHLLQSNSLVVSCRSGNRSRKWISQLFQNHPNLTAAQRKRVINLSGGINRLKMR